MKKITTVLIALFVLGAIPSVGASEVVAERNGVCPNQYASITFRNMSGYTMTVKIIGVYGGLYQTVVLGPMTSQKVSFARTATYKLKIKATRNGRSSYHKGGDFSVTCSEYEWTEGEMSFQMSTYGNGLGPSISAEEFERNN